MDYTKQSPVILSLCTGGLRGLERGFENACTQLGWNAPSTSTYVEIEAFIVWNLVKQMEQGVLAPAPIWTNLKTFNAKPLRGKIDGIFAGYPCQPFSVAGNQKGQSDPRHLFPYIKRIIKTVKPVFCFFENVPGHISLGYDQVYRSLYEMGYAVEAGIFSAAEVGATQQRERLFILAIRHELSNSNSNRHIQSRTQKQPTKRGRDAQRNVGASRTKVLDYTNGIRLKPQYFISTRRYCAELTSKMGYTYRNLSRESRNTPCSRQERFRASRASSGSKPNELAYANCFGVFKGIKRSAPKIVNENVCAWPAPPGYEQHEWEQPRTQPRLGSTINGYDFREDLLRMAGNGVVYQSAEKAFITLLNKLNSSS